MPAEIIDGRRIANEIKEAIRHDVEIICKRQKRILTLTALQIGSSASSDIYLNAQKNLARELGIKCHIESLPKETSQKDAEREIVKLNSDDTITGIIIQTPVPKHIVLERLFAKICPSKDAEGLNPLNVGRLIYGDWVVAPCTANACMKLIDYTGVNLRGKEVVIVGHSAIVGKPLSLMLLSKMATITICHIGTYERNLLKKHVQQAEVLVVSVGKAHLIKGDWIRKGAIIIDVGINKYKGTLAGDVDFEAAKKRASYITPVPGGIGPVTTIMLMKNLVELYKQKA